MPTPGCPAACPACSSCSRARASANRLAVLGERGDHRKHHAQRVPGAARSAARSWVSSSSGCSSPSRVRALPGTGSPRAASAGTGAACRTDVERAQDQRPAAQPLRHLLVGGELLLLGGKVSRSRNRNSVRRTSLGAVGHGYLDVRRRPDVGDHVDAASVSRLRRLPRRGERPARRSLALGPLPLVAAHELLRRVDVHRPRRRRGRAFPRAPPAAVPDPDRPGSRASAPGSRCATSRCRRRWRCPGRAHGRARRCRQASSRARGRCRARRSPHCLECRPRAVRRPAARPPSGLRLERSDTRRRASGSRPPPTRLPRPTPAPRSAAARRRRAGRLEQRLVLEEEEVGVEDRGVVLAGASGDESRVASISARTRSIARSSASHSALGSVAGSVGISGSAARKWRAAPSAVPGAPGGRRARLRRQAEPAGRRCGDGGSCSSKSRSARAVSAASASSACRPRAVTLTSCPCRTPSVARPLRLRPLAGRGRWSHS